MSKPMIHARSSAKKFGGQPEEYLEIHDFMDSSKAVFPDNRHRALTHNSWFIFVMERVFGHEIQVAIEIPCGCEGSPSTPACVGDPTCRHCSGSGTTHRTKPVSVRDICEQHILEDFGGKFIPSPGDYLEGMEFKDWMNNGMGGHPTSHRRVVERRQAVRRVMPGLD